MVFMTPLSVILYVGLSALTADLLSVSSEPITMKVVELEATTHNIAASVFLLDREWYFAIGRIASMLLMLALYLYGGSNLVFRGLMLIIAVAQIPGIIILTRITKQIQQTR
jgi:hypothetical protein